MNGRTCVCGCAATLPRGRRVYASAACAARVEAAAKTAARADLWANVPAGHPLGRPDRPTRVTAARVEHFETLGPGPIGCSFCAAPTSWADLVVRVDRGCRRPVCRACSPYAGAVIALAADVRPWASAALRRAAFDALAELSAAARSAVRDGPHP